MKKKLRLRISRMISSFQTCREKKSASALPPVFCISPSNPKKLDIEFPSPTPPPPPRPSPSRRIAAVVASTAGCRSCAPMSTMRPSLSPAVDIGADDLSRARETPAYLWRKEEKWHVVTCAEEFERRRRKIDDCEDEDDDDLFPANANVRNLSARRKREMELRRRRRCRKPKSKSRKSTSSVASGSWFSSDDDEQNDEREDYDDNDYDDDTDTLLSSRSFSTDYELRCRRCPSPEAPSPRTSSSMLSRLVACGGLDDGGVKVKESFAVVKRSEDPRGDFRRSMAEMVVEKGLYDATDLEQLLHCFLSLNSRQHHRAIVSAFADIWEALFPSETSPHDVGC